jgi:hypothetical protein
VSPALPDPHLPLERSAPAAAVTLVKQTFGALRTLGATIVDSGPEGSLFQCQQRRTRAL